MTNWFDALNPIYPTQPVLDALGAEKLPRRPTLERIRDELGRNPTKGLRLERFDDGRCDLDSGHFVYSFQIRRRGILHRVDTRYLFLDYGRPVFLLDLVVALPHVPIDRRLLTPDEWEFLREALALAQT